MQLRREFWTFWRYKINSYLKIYNNIYILNLLGIRMVFDFKRLLGRESGDADDYVEIDLGSAEPKEKKVVVKPFVLKSFDNMNEILDSLRNGYTIAVIDIKPLKSKDIIELKRAISKIKKTVDALEGSIAGFGDNIVIATPQFAHIHKPVADKKVDRADFLN